MVFRWLDARTAGTSSRRRSAAPGREMNAEKMGNACFRENDAGADRSIGRRDFRARRDDAAMSLARASR